MAEATFRIPSKAVQYGYIEIPMPIAEGASPEALASIYISFVYAFQKEEQEALKRLSETVREAPMPKAPRPYDEDVQEAVNSLAEGLGGVSVVGASGIAPWDDSDLTAAANPKPWETDVTAPAVLDAAW